MNFRIGSSRSWNTFKKAGKVGLWTKADAQSYFDNFEVEEDEDQIWPEEDQ